MSKLQDLINQIEIQAKATDFADDKESLQAIEWYLKRVSEATESEIPESDWIFKSPERERSTTMLGNMYMFRYEPKGKDTLPYYDRNPLVIPIEPTVRMNGAFLGLNLHYLPPKTRAIFFEKLQRFKNNTKYNNDTKIVMTYNFLKTTSLLKEYRPAIKRYNLRNVRTRFIHIHPSEWNVVIFLPTHNFIGQSAELIWEESLRKI